MIKRTLYFGNPVYLSVKERQLKIENRERTDFQNTISSIAIEDIGVIVLDNQQIVCTNRVFQLLLEKNTVIMLCNEKHMPQAIIYPFEGNTTQSETYRNQIEAKIPLRKQLWQQTVIAKIKNQAELLKSEGISIQNMLQWSYDVSSGDAQNHEARAAAYYWDNIFSFCFKRSRLGDFPNNLLNYGYAVLRAVIARSIVGSGLLPTLGIHHRNKYNAFCLADDIMEPYRPYVDKVVLQMVKEEIVSNDELTSELKKRLLTIPAMDVNIDGQRSPLMIASQRTSASLASCFAGEARKIIYPQMKV